MGVYDLPQYGPIPATNPNNAAVGNYFSGATQVQAPSLAPTNALTNGIQAPGKGATAGTPRVRPPRWPRPGLPTSR